MRTLKLKDVVYELHLKYNAESHISSLSACPLSKAVTVFNEIDIEIIFD